MPIIRMAWPFSNDRRTRNVHHIRPNHWPGYQPFTVWKDLIMEPKVFFATVRDSTNDKGYAILDIECRFEDGQKFAAVKVDGEFPELAQKIATFLTTF